MDFNSMSKEDRLNVYSQALKSTYTQIFCDFVKAGLDPGTFSIDTFTYDPLLDPKAHDPLTNVLLLMEKIKEINKQMSQVQ